MNHENIGFAASTEEIMVTLDCETVVLPAGRHSLVSIRTYLEFLALSCQRVLGEVVVDGNPVDLSQPQDRRSFRRVDAITIPLTELPLLLLATAGQQVSRARASVEAALTLVLINDPSRARELWWTVASQLKEPVLTLSLMPEHLCQLWCGTTFGKLRRWQLEQVSLLLRRVDEACDLQDNIQLSDALEKVVLPWLDKLGEHIRLWHEATLAGTRLGARDGST
jgi:hypothetical protein